MRFGPVSMSAPDIEVNRERVTGEIWGKMVCVIGGAGKWGQLHRSGLRLETMSVIFDAMTGQANAMRRDLKNQVMWVNMLNKNKQ